MIYLLPFTVIAYNVMLTTLQFYVARTNTKAILSELTSDFLEWFENYQMKTNYTKYHLLRISPEVLIFMSL